MRYRRSRPAAVLVAAVALVVTAAGPAVAAHDTAADQAIATSGVVALGDVPAGWTSQPGSDAYQAFSAAAAKVKECRPFLAALKKAEANPHASSPQLQNGTEAVQSEVTVFGNAADAEVLLDLYGSVATERCLEKVVPGLAQTELSKDPAVRANLAKVSLVASDAVVPTAVGTATHGYQFVLAVDGKDGTSRNYYVDDQMVQLGRAISRYRFTALDTPVDGVRDPAVTAANTRLEKALGLSLVAGETAALRDELVPIKGYTYLEPNEEIIQDNVAFLTDPEIVSWGCLAGHTDHMVTKGAEQVGVVKLYEYKPECTSEPGFQEAELISDAASWASDENGNQIGEVTVKTIGGTPVALVTVTGNPDYWATTYMWFDGNVEWIVSSDAPAPAPAALAFVQKVIADQNAKGKGK